MFEVYSRGDKFILKPRESDSSSPELIQNKQNAHYLLEMYREGDIVFNESALPRLSMYADPA